MAQRHEWEPTDGLEARNDDAKLGVHCLSEFVFCPRAGLCLYEQDEEFVEREERGTGGYLPIYDQVELQRNLKAVLGQFWTVLVAGNTAAFVCAVIAWYTGRASIWIAAGVVFSATILVLIDRGYRVFVVTQYLKIWKDARPRLPDPDSPRTQDVHWCELMAAGFAAVEPMEPYVWDAWKLGGKPWRVLQHGDLRIPVFLHRTKWKGLFPQHFVRMTAYCRLLEVREGFRSPYGVILQSGSYAAVAIPNNSRSREALREALTKARSAIRDSEQANEFPPVPGNGAVCSECHLGRPRPFWKGQQFLRHQSPLPAIVTSRRHSHCGDRFRWVPPHKNSQASG